MLMAYPEHGAINLLFVVYGLFVVHESFGCYKVYNIRFWVMEDVYEGVCGSWRIVYVFRSYLLKDFFPSYVSLHAPFPALHREYSLFFMIIGLEVIAIILASS